jgi:SAM-dependent methyltransferase
MTWYAFEPDFYRQTYPDVRDFADEESQQHYMHFGIKEGRLASGFGTRETFLKQVQSTESVLEIGPFVSPLMSGARIKYLDILSRDELLDRAASLGLDTSQLPSEIHYTGSIDEIRENFDAVISSHSIEHQPDLVRHLQQVGRVLRGGGLYYLMIPDKRYCFDHFMPESTIAGVLEAYYDGRQAHTLKSVVEHIALTTHNIAERHWANDHGDFPAENQNERINAALELYESQSSRYIDVHAWYFTPKGFYNIVEALRRQNLIAFRSRKIFPTLRGTSEFFAILELDA